MSSSSFSFSSSEDEGVLQADGASASEGRIVVAASRALSNPSTGERDAGAEKGGNVEFRPILTHAQKFPEQLENRVKFLVRRSSVPDGVVQ